LASGLAALLDDIAVIAKAAAASLDDISTAAGQAGAKAAGVVIDDTAVTPRYVTGFTPDRELPVIGKIAIGSLKNKLLILLPSALVLSAVLPAAITPLLMLGGTYLCYEGAEKLLEAVRPHEEHAIEEEVAEVSSADHEAKMVAGAIRTDFILSAEIMAISLADVADRPIWMQAVVLFVVGVAITVGVYGLVGVIVKVDDVGLHLARTGSRVAQVVGRGLVLAMPKLLAALSWIGVAAMLWVGGGIVLHGLHGFHLTPLPGWVEHAGVLAGEAAPFANALATSVAEALGAGAFGLLLGGVVVAVHHAVVGVLAARKAS
jgi:predicted DNA repair protein MutK